MAPSLNTARSTISRVGKYLQHHKQLQERAEGNLMYELLWGTAKSFVAHVRPQPQTSHLLLGLAKVYIQQGALEVMHTSSRPSMGMTNDFD